jgi:hypothetical protein
MEWEGTGEALRRLHVESPLATPTHTDMPLTPLHHAVAHLRAGRWAEAHDLAQQDNSPLGAWLHGILHLQEGDLSNAEYWFGRARRDFQGRGTVAQELAKLEAALSD